jgi:3-oxoacyl-[acyl-carrier-protein] synthase-3
VIDDRSNFLKQDGKVVFKYAVNGMVSVTKEIMEENNLTADQIDWLVPHQANLRIIQNVREQLKIEPEKVMVNIEKYGNTTAATIPLCLYDYEKKFKKGDNIILVAFGAGFTWGAVYLKWMY